MPDVATLLMLLAIGAIAGLAAGLLGIGGGVIVVPALLFLFERQGVDSSVVVQCAIGTSLATIMFTAVSSVRAHQARGAIHWPVFRRIVPGVLIGGAAGAVIATALPGEILKILFGIFLLMVAFELGRSTAIVPRRPLPRQPAMAGAGLIIGIMAALFGVGGGTMTVPFLVWCSVPMVEAVATSAAVGLPIAIAGTLGYIVAGWNAAALPPGSLGFVVLVPFAGIAIASVLFAPLGARLAHRLPQATLRRVFAAFLVLVALRLLLG